MDDFGWRCRVIMILLHRRSIGSAHVKRISSLRVLIHQPLTGTYASPEVVIRVISTLNICVYVH